MNTSLGALVRHRRRSLGLTQAQLAHRLALMGQGLNVACFESGLGENPQAGMLNALTAALEWPLGILDPVNGEETAPAVKSGSRLRDGLGSAPHRDLERLNLARVELMALRDLHGALHQWMDDLEVRVQAALIGVSSRGEPVRFDD